MTRRAKSNPAADYDSPWKDAIELFFEPFMAFFFPEAHAEIDWSRPYEFLDKEFQKITRDDVIGRSYVDKLVKVYLKNGEELWVLIHIEVQAEEQAEFPRRMFVYHAKIFLRFGREVNSFAILADDNPNWRPSSYSHGRWSKATLDYQVAKLLDFRDRSPELQTNPNPFAVVVIAHLKALETSRQPYRRRDWKLRLVRGLYARGYSRREVRILYRIIDHIITLPDALVPGFDKAVAELEKEYKMPYVTSTERYKTNRARLEQARASVLTVLRARFPDMPSVVNDTIVGIDDLATLQSLLARAATAADIAGFERTLGEHVR